MPQQALVLDSSQISAHESCPTIWANRDIINRDLVIIDPSDPTKIQRPSEAIAMGTLGHKYLEIYYKVLLLLK